MSSAGILILAWLGRLSGGSFLCGGPCYLLFPWPITPERGPVAALLCLLGILVFSTTEISVYYLGMLVTARSIKEAGKIVDGLQKAIGGAVAIIKKDPKGE